MQRWEQKGACGNFLEWLQLYIFFSSGYQILCNCQNLFNQIFKRICYVPGTTLGVVSIADNETNHYTSWWLYFGILRSVRRRQWHPTPVLLPGESHGQRSLVGCSPRGCEESDMTERLHFHFSLSCIGQSNFIKVIGYV